MKTFKEYILEQEKRRMIVPASTGIPEELPHGFSVTPVPEPNNKSNSKPKPKAKSKAEPPKPLTFAERIARAKALANK